MIRVIVSVIAFQVAWTASAYGAVHDVPQLGVLACLGSLAIGVFLAPDRRGLLALALALGLFGLVAETSILSAGFTSYGAPGPYRGVAPVWIVGLWMAFATLIEPTFGWLRGRLILASILGALAAPLSYYAAMRLGALKIAEPEWAGLLLIGAMWAVAMPLAMWLNRRMEGGR